MIKLTERSSLVDSIDLSKDYYFLIKDTFNEYSKYIRQYKIISMNFIKKLSQFQEKFSQPLLDLDRMKNKYKNIKIKDIYELISLFPKIVQKLIDSFNNSATGMDNVIQNLDKILLEKINIEKKEEGELEFETAKNNLGKFYRNIDKNKNFFRNKMSFTEDMVYKYYSIGYKENQNVTEEKNKKERDKKEKDKNDNLITKEQLNASITEAKKSETQYFSSFDSIADLEKTYNNISQKYKQNLSKTSLNLTHELKQVILDITLLLKASLSDPLNEIALMLEKLNDIEKNNNLSKIVNDSFKINKNIERQKPKLYKLKILKEPKIIDGKRNPKSHIVILEDGFDQLEYFDNYSMLQTINTLYANFDLIEKDKKFNFKKEFNKLQTKELSDKLLSYIKKDKSKITNTGNINLQKEEITKLKELLNEHDNRVVFLQALNTFRAKGLHGIPKDIFDFFNELFILMCNTIGRDKDYHTAKNLIILSQTYYYLDDGNKLYLLEGIQKNEIFQNFKFWEGYTQFTIEKEIIKSIQNDKKNGTLIKKTQKESDDMYATVVFAQVVSVADNMISFNFDTKKIKEIIKPIIKHYNINEESIKILDDIIYKDNVRKSVFLSDEIKLVDTNKLNNYYQNFDVFGNKSIISSNENQGDEIDKVEKLEDIFDNPKNEDKEG